MAIIDIFPHIKHRIVDIDDSEKLSLYMKYGFEVVVLDIDMNGAPHETFDNKGVIFRLEDSRQILDPHGYQFLTTCLKPIKTLYDMRDIVIIRDHNYGTFELVNNICWMLNGISWGGVDNNFNEFWKLTPDDDEYLCDTLRYFNHVKNKRVSLPRSRFFELSKQYGSNFIILDICIPTDCKYTKIDEGVVFWFYNGIGKDKNGWLVSVKPHNENYDNAVIIHPNRYGEFERKKYGVVMENVVTNDPCSILAFNEFWEFDQ